MTQLRVSGPGDARLRMYDGLPTIDDAPVAARWGRNLLVAHERLAQP